MPSLDLYQLPQHAPPEALTDATVIVVDLLRASTTVCTALAAGAECVMPFAEIDETLAAAEKFGRQNVLLGGERHGKLIPGFDLGNSPSEYTPDRIAGRRVLFTTTNGARAINYAKHAHRVLIGAAANCLAVARAVNPSQNARVMCAGTDGEPGLDDILAGGAIIDALLALSDAWTLKAGAQGALKLWRAQPWIAAKNNLPLSETFTDTLIECTDGAQNLVAIGLESDVAACAKFDTLTVVPELNPTINELRPA